MATDFAPRPEAPATELVAGIIGDVQELLGQHLRLLKHEIKSDLAKSRDVAVSLAVGAAVALPALFLLVAFLVGVLAHFVPAVPWWGWCGILGGALGGVAAVLITGAIAKAKTLNPLPDETAQAAKENVQWIAKAT